LGLAVGLLVPVLNATLPFRWKLKSVGPGGPLVQMGADDFGPPGGRGGMEAGLGMAFGTVFAVALLPLLLGVGAGWLRGSIRVKTLLPESVLLGWLLIAGLPLFLLLTLFSFTIIDQIPSILLFLSFALVLLPSFAYLGITGTMLRPIKKSMGRTALPILEW